MTMMMIHQQQKNVRWEEKKGNKILNFLGGKVKGELFYWEPEVGEVVMSLIYLIVIVDHESSISRSSCINSW